MLQKSSKAMMDTKQKEAEKQFIEDTGLLIERGGIPRMAGRILGWLMIADPPHQSIDELTKELMASKGSISTMTRLLIQIGLIERVSFPGVRHDYFRIRPGVVQHILKHTSEDLRIGKELSERGLSLVADKSELSRRWVKEMHELYVFIEKEWPSLIERWEQSRRVDGQTVK